MSLKVDNVGAERMSGGRLFRATGPATPNVKDAAFRTVLAHWALYESLIDIDVDILYIFVAFAAASLTRINK